LQHSFASLDRRGLGAVKQAHCSPSSMAALYSRGCISYWLWCCKRLPPQSSAALHVTMRCGPSLLSPCCQCTLTPSSGRSATLLSSSAGTAQLPGLQPAPRAVNGAACHWDERRIGALEPPAAKHPLTANWPGRAGAAGADRGEDRGHPARGCSRRGGGAAPAAGHRGERV
jgi:hypothetical protein